MNVVGIANQLIHTFGYLGICLICVLPLPSEVVLPLIGLGVSYGKFNLFLVLLCTIATEIIVSLFNYMVGYYKGNDALIKIEKKSPKSKKIIDKLGLILNKYKWFTIILARLVPLLRTYISVLAGVEKLNKYIFIIISTIAIIVVNTFLVELGYYTGNNQILIKKILRKCYIIIIVIAIIFVLILVVYKYKKSKK
ncbi:DedA family protein [Clostridium sp.]|uniref:DedA family protein n=1 Tax=Clostridium sp. TaxID=1506 RepID=UPI002A91C5B6|nr:VTT domain-containing protein [Clostridium sp.]MDY6013244.1 VTT domain-containing protein [Clostridium sp.]